MCGPLHRGIASKGALTYSHVIPFYDGCEGTWNNESWNDEDAVGICGRGYNPGRVRGVRGVSTALEASSRHGAYLLSDGR